MRGGAARTAAAGTAAREAAGAGGGRRRGEAGGGGRPAGRGGRRGGRRHRPGGDGAVRIPPVSGVREWHCGGVLDGEQYYQAAASKDARFDGVFFTAVTSTGIYCRPSCPAIT